MQSIDEREAKIKARLREPRTMQLFGDSNVEQSIWSIWGRRAIALMIFFIFFGIAFFGSLRYETVHGSFLTSFFWQRYLISIVATDFLFRTLVLLLFPARGSFVSFVNEIRLFFGPSQPSFILRILVVDLIAGYLILLLPVSGIFQFANGFFGEHRPIEIAGQVAEIEAAPLKIDIYLRSSQNHLSYRVIKVLNLADQKKYVMDVPDAYFLKHQISVGQTWSDQIFRGAFDVYYRKAGRWANGTE